MEGEEVVGVGIWTFTAVDPCEEVFQLFALVVLFFERERVVAVADVKGGICLDA